MMDYTFSAEYARFIMPTVEELEEERKIASMPETEKEVYYIYRQMLDGKSRDTLRTPGTILAMRMQ